MNVRSTKPSPSPLSLGKGEATHAPLETLPPVKEGDFCARQFRSR
jgi:hypothetical protein